MSRSCPNRALPAPRLLALEIMLAAVLPAAGIETSEVRLRNW